MALINHKYQLKRKDVLRSLPLFRMKKSRDKALGSAIAAHQKMWHL
jgi:hypothetical protein